MSKLIIPKAKVISYIFEIAKQMYKQTTSNSFVLPSIEDCAINHVKQTYLIQFHLRKMTVRYAKLIHIIYGMWK